MNCNFKSNLTLDNVKLDSLAFQSISKLHGFGPCTEGGGGYLSVCLGKWPFTKQSLIVVEALWHSVHLVRIPHSTLRLSPTSGSVNDYWPIFKLTRWRQLNFDFILDCNVLKCYAHLLACLTLLLWYFETVCHSVQQCSFLLLKISGE